MSLRDEPTALFQRSWSLYDAIAAENYMFHREIYALVAEFLTERHRRAPYSILDLGCGNARFLAPCLRAAPPARYGGVDLSGTALAEARGHLSGLAGVELHEREMVGFLASGVIPHDVIFTGYAAHHLDAAGKQAFFRGCAGALAPGGELLMVDVLRADGQSRDDYLAAYLRTMREEWTAASAAAIEEACGHVAAHDFPATFTELAAMAADAGLGHAERLAGHGPHHLLRFSA